MSDEPPIGRSIQDRIEPLNFVIGRDHAGQWIVVERHGLYGGIFGSQDAAARFAKFESGGRRSTISVSSEPLEFYGAMGRAA
jgi:hypothetical protein